MFYDWNKVSTMTNHEKGNILVESEETEQILDCGETLHNTG